MILDIECLSQRPMHDWFMTFEASVPGSTQRDHFSVSVHCLKVNCPHDTLALTSMVSFSRLLVRVSVEHYEGRHLSVLFTAAYTVIAHSRCSD